MDSVTQWISQYFASLSHAESLSMLTIAASALLFILLERVLPYNPGQEVLREGFFDDLVLYTIAQSYILGIIIFSFIIRQHSNRYLWRLHEAHHSPRTVDWLSGSRSHALEILINQTVEFTPIILLGASPEVIAYKGVVSAVWGMYIHSNMHVRSGVLQRFINGPEMHRWHHTTGRGRNRNFSTKLAIWDWMFGTAYLPEGESAREYGLKTPFPPHFFSQFVYAFRRFKRP
jgi:sterol desaturase/sphingolipid hydroxylase (fatty acid hydroxylase superfamily)